MKRILGQDGVEKNWQFIYQMSPYTVGQGIAQRIQEKVSEQTDPKVTISCGVSFWTNGHTDHVKALFKRADDALYMAKNTGKNKVLIQN